MQARSSIRLGSTPIVFVTVAVGALAFAYVLFSRSSTEFQIFLIWAIAVVAVALAMAIKYEASRRTIWLVLGMGLLVKLAGSVARYEVISRAYDGIADATGYYGKGLKIAGGLWRLDPTELLAPQQGGVGTGFMIRISGILVSLSGPSMRAVCLLVALLGFVGVLLFASAYVRVPRGKPVVYLVWMALWPSLIFWPSSVGKEGLLLFALGLAVWGYSRFPAVSSLLPLAAGLLLVGLVRPHIAGLAILAMVVGAVVATGGSRAVAKWYSQLLFWVAALAVTFYLSSGALGVESFESAVALVEDQAEKSAQGGSEVGAASLSPLGIPAAFANTLLRPYLWEAGSPLVLLSAVEVLVLLGLLIWRRRQLWASLRGWREHRLVAFSIVFVVLYCMMLGFAMSNLAIIARQRILLLPMLLLLLQDRSVVARSALEDSP